MMNRFQILLSISTCAPTLRTPRIRGWRRRRSSSKTAGTDAYRSPTQRLKDIARHLGSEGYCSPRHRMSFDSQNEDSTWISFNPRSQGLKCVR